MPVTTDHVREACHERLMEIAHYEGDTENLIAASDPARRHRATQYLTALTGAVERDGGVILLAQVAGSNGEAYQVEIDHARRWAYCSCADRQDRGQICKHIVAVAMRWLAAKTEERTALEALTLL